MFTLHAIPANVFWMLKTRRLAEGPPGPVVVDHYGTLMRLYGYIFTAFGAVCGLVAVLTANTNERAGTAPGALLLLPGLALLVAAFTRK